MKTQKSRTKCSFVKTGVLKLASDLRSKRANDKFYMLEDSYSNKDTIYMKVIIMYIKVEGPYNEVLDLTNYFF